MFSKKPIIIYLLVIVIFSLSVQLAEKYSKKSVLGNYASVDEFVLSTIDKCPPKLGPCLRASAEILLNNLSHEEVISVLERHIKEPEVFNSCHQITHEFGRIEYERTKDIRKVFNIGSYICYEGFFHGAAEAYFLDKHISIRKIDNKFKSSIPSVCGMISDHANKDFYQSCLHGLGHALMYVTENEVPQALMLCDVPKSSLEKEGCYSGVFMENKQDEFSTDHPSRYIHPDDPAYPCTILEAKYRNACYGYQAVRLYSRFGHNFKEAVNFCEKAPLENRVRCIRQVSGHMIGYPRDEKSFSKDCGIIADSRLRSECIIGVAKRFIQRDLGDLTSALRFCSSLESSEKELCISTAEDASRKWN